jgi:hypothetical protein
MPRWVWWTIGLTSSLDLSLNGWAFFHDRPMWHPDVAVVTTLTIALCLWQLGRPVDCT